MKRTLHFFGDSFTQGHALRKSSSIWPRLVAKGLDLKYKNYAQGGASPFFIIHQLIRALTNIKEGDKVIVLETIPDRVELYSNKKRQIVSVTNGALVESLEGELDDNYFNSKPEVVSAFNFIYDHRYKKLGAFANYNTKVLEDFGKYFKGINVEFILISYLLPFDNVKYSDKFETNKGLSKGKNIDAHFTLKGHWQFAKYVSETYFDNKIILPEIPKKTDYII